MANGKIKGITIELDGDTSGLTQALKKVDGETKKVQKELSQVERLLKFDPSNVELLAQKQEMLQKSVDGTTKRLDALKQAQGQVEAQFKSGEIGEEAYRSFQRELVATENKLKHYQSQLSSMQAEQGRFADAQKRLGTYLQATGKDIDDLSSTLGGKLTNAIKSGSASADQLEQALSKIARQSGVTTQDMDKFNKALRQVDDGSDIDKVRKDLDLLGQSADQAKSDVNGLGGELGALAGTLAVGGGIGGTIATALDMSNLQTKISISMEIDESSKAAVTQAVKDVTKYGVDAEEALEAVRRQWALNADATDEANARIIEGAGAITKAYQGIDMIELVQETNEIAAALKITNEEALALTNSLLKAGFPPEQLDTIAEYGTQMQAMGFDAKQIQAIFEAGIDTKTWNIDNLNDGVKEARITMSEFGLEVDKATGELLKKAGMSQKQFQNWGKAVASGGSEGATAMSEVSQWLQTIEDDALRNELAIKVFGTKAEDQLSNMTAVFEGVADAQDKSAENQEKLNSLVEGLNSDPSVQMKEAFNNMMTALAPLLTKVSEFVTKVAEWAAENPKLTATFAAIGTIVGIVVGAFMALAPIVSTITGIFGSLSAAGGVLGGAIAALSGPIGWAIAIIAALVAAGIALWKNWDSVSKWLSDTWNTLKTNASNAFTQIKDGIVKTWNEVKTAISTVWNSITTFLTFTWDMVKVGATTAFNLIKNIITTAWNTIKSTTSTVWNGIKSFVEGQWNILKAGATTIFNGIKTVITNAWNNIKTTTTTVWNNIKTLVETAINTVKGVVTTAMQLMKGDISGAWNTIKTTFSGALTAITGLISTNFTNMKSAVSSKMTEVKTTISNAWNGIKSFMSSISLYDIGRNIIQGLINGISAMISSLMATARSIASSIKDTISGALDIHSPSRVMKGFGINIGEGLVEGMDDMISKVAQSSARLSGAIVQAQALQTGGTSYSNSIDKSRHFSPVVHVNGGSNDARLMDRTLRRLSYQI